MIVSGFQIKSPLGEKLFFLAKRKEKMIQVKSLSFEEVVQEDSTPKAFVE